MVKSHQQFNISKAVANYHLLKPCLRPTLETFLEEPGTCSRLLNICGHAEFECDLIRSRTSDVRF